MLSTHSDAIFKVNFNILLLMLRYTKLYLHTDTPIPIDHVRKEYP